MSLSQQRGTNKSLCELQMTDQKVVAADQRLQSLQTLTGSTCIIQPEHWADSQTGGKVVKEQFQVLVFSAVTRVSFVYELLTITALNLYFPCLEVR